MRRPSSVTVSRSPSRVAASESRFRRPRPPPSPRRGVPVRYTWSVRSPACSRMVVGARSPIRQPDGTPTGRRGRRPAPQPPVGGRGDHLVVARRGGYEIGDPAVQQSGVQAARHHVGVGQQESQELDVGGHAQHRGVGQRAVERTQRGRPVGGVGDHLGQHRVVVAADHRAARQPGIHPDAGTVGLGEIEHVTAGGQEAAGGILGVDPGLDGVPAHRDVVLRRSAASPPRRCAPATRPGRRR